MCMAEQHNLIPRGWREAVTCASGGSGIGYLPGWASADSADGAVPPVLAPKAPRKQGLPGISSADTTAGPVKPVHHQKVRTPWPGQPDLRRAGNLPGQDHHQHPSRRTMAGTETWRLIPEAQRWRSAAVTVTGTARQTGIDGGESIFPGRTWVARPRVRVPTTTRGSRSTPH